MEWFTAIVGGLFLIYWGFGIVKALNARPLTRQQRAEPKRIIEPGWPNVPTDEATPKSEPGGREYLVNQLVEKTPAEKILDSLQSLRDAIGEKAEADNQVLRDQLTKANEQLKEARELAERLGISEALTSIANEMQHWPSWSKLEDYDQARTKGITTRQLSMSS